LYWDKYHHTKLIRKVLSKYTKDNPGLCNGFLLWQKVCFANIVATKPMGVRVLSMGASSQCWKNRTCGIKHEHSLLSFSEAYKLMALVLLALITATPTLADMQSIDNFAIDRTEITVGQFHKFVNATGYTTAAEINGGGLVYGSGWGKIDGWVWSTPFGIPARPDEPAVHVTFGDATAYCFWAGKGLPKDME
jgi:hypothetical protein